MNQGGSPRVGKRRKNVCRNGVTRVNFRKYSQNGPSILASASLVMLILASYLWTSLYRFSALFWRFWVLAAKSIKHISKNSPKSSKIPDYTRRAHAVQRLLHEGDKVTSELSRSPVKLRRLTHFKDSWLCPWSSCITAESISWCLYHFKFQEQTVMR